MKELLILSCILLFSLIIGVELPDKTARLSEELMSVQWRLQNLSFVG